MKIKATLIGFFCIGTLCAQTPKVDTIRVMTYNVLNFPDGRNDCSNNLRVPNRQDTLAKVINYTLPDIFIANEVQTLEGAQAILHGAMNSNGRSNYRMAEFAYGNAGGFPHNAVFYNANKLILKEQHIIQTDVRPIDHIVFYGVDPLLDTHFDTTFFEVFAAHLKAGSGSAEQAQRYEQAQLIRNYIDARPANRNYIIGGDFNVYRASESGYVKLTSGGTNPFKDPINRPGSWNSNNSFRDIHTQSTRTNENIECGSTGGMDDRFDQLLVSANVLSGRDSVKYIANTYKTIGNDGNHYNQSIISGSNSLYPASLVHSLYYMSDHLPVVMDMKVNYPLTNGLALQPINQYIACNGTNTGAIRIIPHAGVAPYRYAWAHDVNNTTAEASQLVAGQYCVTVTDALNQVDQICVNLGQPEPLVINNSFISSDFGGCIGAVIPYLAGGVAPYTYSWNGGAATNLSYIDNLCEGTYTLVATDANGCTVTRDYTIQFLSVAEELEFNSVKLAPNPASEAFTIQWSGNDNVTFELFDLMGKKVELNTIVNTPFDQTFSIAGLQSGVYVIRAIGANWSSRIIKK